MFKGERGRLVFFVSSWILLAYAWRGFGDNPVGFGWILSTGQAFRLRCRRAPVWMAGVLPPAECGKVNHQQSPDQKPLMPGLHTRALPCHEKSAEQRVSGGVSDSAMAQSRISRVLRGAARRSASGSPASCALARRPGAAARIPRGGSRRRRRPERGGVGAERVRRGSLGRQASFGAACEERRSSRGGSGPQDQREQRQRPHRERSVRRIRGQRTVLAI